MSKKEKTKKITGRRLIYTIISELANIIDCEFDVSTYVTNREMHGRDLKFSQKNIARFIKKNSTNKCNNRFFLAVCVNTKKSQNVLDNVQEKIWKSKILDYIEEYEPDAKVKIFSKKNQDKQTKYVLIVFYFPDQSSIEIIITTQSLDKKIISRDEEGEANIFNKKLSRDIQEFEKERKMRKISN